MVARNVITIKKSARNMIARNMIARNISAKDIITRICLLKT